MPVPKVSVLMSVYNGAQYLKEAIESILNQTFSDFEFIIINDASTDSSRKIITGYKDPRIVLVDNAANLGLTRSLNKGLNLAQGEYIARMDSDDICLPDRLIKQVQFMDANPEIGVCGTWVKIIGERNGEIWKYPSRPRVIKCMLLFGPVLAHPTAMLRMEAFKKYGLLYNTEFKRTQDYELWARAANYLPFSNLQQVLLLYRLHPSQVGRNHRRDQDNLAGIVRMSLLEQLGIRPTPEEFELHQSLSTLNINPEKEWVNQTEIWLRKLKDANEKALVYQEPAFSQVLASRWLLACNVGAVLGMWSWKRFWDSEFSGQALSNLKAVSKLFVKCLVKKHHKIN